MNEMLIDPTPLDAIRALEQAGQPSLLDTIVRMFVEQSETLAGQIRDAAQAGNADAVREAAHSLKSSSANVGAMRVSELSFDLEVASRDGEMGSANALADRLHLAIREANQALLEIVGVEI